MVVRRLFVSLPLSALLLACSGDDATSGASATTGAASTSSTTEASASTTGESTTTTTGALECNPVPDDVQALQACGLPGACGQLYDYSQAGGSCIGPLEDGSDYNDDERCALQRLAARDPGVLHAQFNCPDSIYDRYVHVVGDVAYVVRLSSGPCFGCPCEWSESWSTIQRCQLRPAADFTACEAAADAATRIACMDPTQWFTSCEDAPPACAP